MENLHWALFAAIVVGCITFVVLRGCEQRHETEIECVKSGRTFIQDQCIGILKDHS